MSEEQNSTIVRDTSMVLMFIVGVSVVAFIVAKIIFGTPDVDDSDEAVAKRLAPVGSVNIGEPFLLDDAAQAPSAPVTTPTETKPEATVAEAPAVAVAPAAPGKAAYGKICFVCHDAGVGGAPKYGDAAAWTPRRQKGTEMLVINAINGMTGETGIMPPKGGLTSLSDDEVRASVMYLLASVDANQAGAASAPAPVATPAVETPAAAAIIAEPVAEVAPAAVVNDGRGKEVYDSACFICHATGVAGAPKIGDVDNWAPRISQGAETLYSRAVKGFMGESGLMPPKGGRMDFSDDDVNAAVDYMVTESQ